MIELPTGTVTFAFTDIEGSTRLLNALGADYPATLARHNALVREQIRIAGGQEVKTEGDSFFVVFRTAPAALGWAAEVQRVLAEEPWPVGADVRVRIGLHTGEGLLSEDDYVGIDVHRAARVGAAGHGGQVVVSETTRALAAGALPSGVGLRDLGEHRLKDLPAPMHLHQVVIDGLRSDFPPLRSIGKGSLPEPLTSFVGREREIDEVSLLLGRGRLVTLTGPGGTGKTRLSIEIARSVRDGFAEGAWFVPLETVTEPDLVLPAMARALGLREDAKRPAAAVLAEALGERRLLFVLDNLEQVIAAAPQIAGLLREASGPSVLCSSREAMRVSGEQEYAVPPLEIDPAVRLFIERAQQVRPDFAPNDKERSAIADICRMLDRLPLAIELAAARVRLFPLPTLAARLADRLATLGSGQRDVPERQRTLRGAIDWSYELLDPAEREVFARLSVFAGGANLEAIEAVVDPGGEVTPDVLATLGSLVDKSLVLAEGGITGEARFRMLETIRDYAAERLAASAVARDIRDRHLASVVKLAKSIEPELNGAQPEVSHAVLDSEHDNVRAAIEWSLVSGQPAAGLSIGGYVWRFWQQRGHMAEGRALFERLLEAPDQESNALARGRGLTGYGGIRYWQGDRPAARRAYEEALELYQRAGDERDIALGMFDLAFPVSLAGEITEARRLLDESAALFHRLGDERGWLMAGQGMAAVAMMSGDLTGARDVADSLVGEYRRLGMKFRYADTLGLLGVIYLALGDANGARRALGEGLKAWNEIGDMSAWGRSLQLGARLAFIEGRLIDGARLLGALQSLRDRGEPFLTPAETLGMPNPEQSIRDAMPADEFAAAFEVGRRWPIDEALDNVLG